MGNARYNCRVVQQEINPYEPWIRGTDGRLSRFTILNRRQVAYSFAYINLHEVKYTNPQPLILHLSTATVTLRGRHLDDLVSGLRRQEVISITVYVADAFSGDPPGADAPEITGIRIAPPTDPHPDTDDDPD